MLVLVTETMSMRRGVPGGLRMAPAEAHDTLGLIPLQFADARGEWPRPRTPCPTCGDEMVLRWGNQRRPHLAHLPKPGAKRTQKIEEISTPELAEVFAINALRRGGRTPESQIRAGGASRVAEVRRRYAVMKGAATRGVSPPALGRGSAH